MPRRYRMLARYNAWANERVYAAAFAVSEDDYRRNGGAFFGSLHGTLNHLLVADKIWMRRFTGEGDAPTRLDEILHEARKDLLRARRTEDARIVAFVDRLDAKRLNALFRYTPISNPVPVEQELAPALDHFFNHQTHHRGQVHCLLTGLGRPAPVLDLVAYQRETGDGAVRRQT